MTKIPVSIALVLALALAALGCGTSKDDTGSTTASASDCTPAKLDTHAKGQLTVATDDPAYEPYFVDDEPEKRQGLRERRRLRDRRTARLQEGPDQVDDRALQLLLRAGAEGLRLRRQRDLDHAGARKGGRFLGARTTPPIRRSSRRRAPSPPKRKSLADLEDAKIGVQISTTSQEAVEEQIDPSSEIQVFNNSNDVISALKNGQVEAVAVDVPTALYVTAVQVPDATIVGQFPAPGGDQWGALLAKGSSLTACVSKAVEELQSSGELEEAQPAVDEQGRRRPRTALGRRGRRRRPTGPSPAEVMIRG